jgi:hypothetical protein
MASLGVASPHPIQEKKLKNGLAKSAPNLYDETTRLDTETN